MTHAPKKSESAVTGRKDNANKARASPERGVRRKHEAETVSERTANRLDGHGEAVEIARRVETTYPG
jgi:hypothetical protein